MNLRLKRELHPCDGIVVLAFAVLHIDDVKTGLSFTVTRHGHHYPHFAVVVEITLDVALEFFYTDYGRSLLHVGCPH